MADLDPVLTKKILDIAQRRREPSAEHHNMPDDLGAGFEVPTRRLL